ncbi:hypothetical protein EKG37_12795 [Robertmurraya yapensis]|uniref:Uncharacterized protein n=1 Tax=Bacillus yapensis TaxID=2492960 RepID=A0A3S0ICA8_9BACI|nr:hypothetical protein [Bacillus yapensis]RTR30377.1 hypothetical protein EKG37_12795 [Bacillus yapensis]TKS95196.1 hypothetical protein FAR12_12795 [Bacillus yapensis]
MFIKSCSGYELEKEKPNTSEDFFNRSEVTFQEDGSEKTLQVLYLRYFDEVMGEFTPYQQDPLFQIGDRAVSFKDIVAIVCLIKNPGFRHRKRVYFNSKHEFSSFFKDVDYEKIKTIFEGLVHQNGYELRSPLEFIQQPQ